jgi:hypothetical protein
VAGTAIEKILVVHLDADVDPQTVSQSDRSDVPHLVLETLSSLVMALLVMEDRRTRDFGTYFGWVIRRCQSMALLTPFH